MKLEHWINSDFQADHVPNPTKEPKLDFQQVKKAVVKRFVPVYKEEEMLPLQ